MKVALYAFIALLFFATGPGCNEGDEQIWVLDNEKILTNEQISRLDSLFKAHEKKTTNEIALVTTADYGSDTSIFFFGLHFARKHGIGKKAKNNGLVVAFSMAKREVNISTGYGTEKILTDEIAKAFIDSVMVPHFKNGEAFRGLWNGCLAIVAFLERPENVINGTISRPATNNVFQYFASVSNLSR